MAIGGKKSGDAAAKVDPLGDLVAQDGKPALAAQATKTDLAAQDVTFPSILSDGTSRRPRSRRSSKPDPSAALAPTAPPPPADVLPVVPLPAQNVLQASPVVTRPRDGLTKAASDAQASAEDAQDSAAAQGTKAATNSK